MEDYIIIGIFIVTVILFLIGIVSPKGSTKRKICLTIVGIAYFPLTAILLCMRWSHIRKKARREQRQNETWFFW